MSGRRAPWVAALIVGLGMIAAPVAFQMFGRAPEGGTMIDEFEPYMTTAEIEQFRGYLDEIGAVQAEWNGALRPALESEGAVDDGTQVQGVDAFAEAWPDIEADMGDLLDRMEANLDNYEAVAALPPFPLFPWFFVLPGLFVAGVAAWGLSRSRRATPGRAPAWALLGLGVALVLAPVAFQMFTRAPQGRDMIDDFRPMMTPARVQAVQGYFVTLGVAEGQLRTTVVPLAEDHGIDSGTYPAATQFSEDWPGILADFNPMVATMSDNLDNFAAVDALPRFDLFPWFFVIPGVLVAASGGLALRTARRPADHVGAIASSEPEPAEGGQP